MERNRDLRRATISTVNALPRRRSRITTLRDSTDEDGQMELQETVSLRDREQMEKKDRDRDFSKRRRVDRLLQRSGESYRENESTDSSDEEYYAEEEDQRNHQRNRMNQLSPTSSSLSNNRRGLRTLRSSPVFRTAVDEMLGVHIPRRARSAFAKRLRNSVSGGFGDDPARRRFSPSPAMVGPIGSGSRSPSSPSASMKKKMKSVEPRSNSKHSSVIQNDIEIEVAEALFDLMKQSQSHSQSSHEQDKVDREISNTDEDEVKRLKAAGVKDENTAFIVQNEQSIKVAAETTLADSVEEQEIEQRNEKEKFPDDSARETVKRDGFVNKEKVGSVNEIESPSCVKVNACDIQDPTVTKSDYPTIVVENKKEVRPEIDLMAPPPLSSFPERDLLIEVASDPKVMTKDFEKNTGTISKDGPLAAATRVQKEDIRVLSNSKCPDLDLEKRRHDSNSSVGGSTTQHQQSRNGHINQQPISLLPFPIGMSSWPGVLPRPGYMPSLAAVLPIDGSFKSSMTMQPPQFKFSQPRSKRCATHQYIANNIDHHQQLMKKSLSAGPTGPATLYGPKSLNIKSMSPGQKSTPGNPAVGDFQGGQNFASISDSSRKDKSSDAAAAFNASTSCKPVLQQVSDQTSASNFLHGPDLIFPIGHHQTMRMQPANSSGPASAIGNATFPSISAGRLSVNLPPHRASGAVSFNQPTLPPNEVSPYMPMLQKNSSPVPTSKSIDLPPFHGGSPMVPYFNSSLYSSPVFNVTQNQQPLSLPHAPLPSVSQNVSTFSGSSTQKLPQGQQQGNTKSSESKFLTAVADEISRKRNNSQNSSFPVQPVNFAAIVSKNADTPQPGSKGGMELFSPAFALSFGSNGSNTAALNLSTMMQNSAIFQMFPDMSRNGGNQKNYQTSEGKNPTYGGQSFNFSKSDTMGTSKIDGSARASGVSVTTTNLQQQQQYQHQQQLIQLQKHHMHQMQQLAGASQVKASTPNGGIFPNNHHVFTQGNNNSSFPYKWDNFPQTVAAEGSPESATSTLVSIPQRKSSQGGGTTTHITFGNSAVSAASSYQGPQQMSLLLAVGSQSNSSISKSTGGSQRTASTVSALPSQDADASQKLSPSCRRNVTSILSTCPPGQISELKY